MEPRPRQGWQAFLYLGAFFFLGLSFSRLSRRCVPKRRFRLFLYRFVRDHCNILLPEREFHARKRLISRLPEKWF